MSWISCKDQLPPPDVYVLCYYAGGNWNDSKDDPNRIVAMRQLYDDRHDPNNRGAGYMWREFGPLRMFAHAVSHWHPLPAPPGSGDQT